MAPWALIWVTETPRSCLETHHGNTQLSALWGWRSGLVWVCLGTLAPSGCDKGERVQSVSEGSCPSWW